MTQQTDESVLAKIEALVHEENALRSSPDLDDDGRAREAAIRVELDQCWDLLRQRRALREFGKDADQAKVRPAKVVENYEQ